MAYELTLLTELDRLLVSFLEENGERDRRLREPRPHNLKAELPSNFAS